MNSLYSIVAMLCLAQLSFAQINERRVASVNVANLHQVNTVVYHSMGDVNVNGYTGDNIFAYSEEFLPSLNSLKQSTSNDVFQQLTAKDFQQREIQLNKVPEFNIEQIDNVIILKTNVYSFNSNIYVLTPQNSSVAVNVKDMGDITIKNIKGGVEANTTAGSVYLENIDGVISANTQNGNIVAEFDQNRTQPLYVSTFVGNIEIIVPKTTNNSVLASSEMGSLYSNFSTNNGLSANATNQHVKNRKINFEINKGGTEFVIYTFKGDIYLRYLDR